MHRTQNTQYAHNPHTICTQYAHTQKNNMQHITDTEQNTENNAQDNEQHSAQNSAHNYRTYSLDYYFEYAYIKNNDTIELYTILHDEV